ncbi:MAG TPA: PAS domain S-box protein [Holophagaceae bacterium]|nr:PAS domain S-box protein [Holophagaceae bacterium]
MSPQPEETPRPAVPPDAPQGGEFQFRALFDCLPDPAWIFDQETLAIRMVNAAALERYGWSREEFLAMTVLDFRPEEEREQLLETLRDYPEPRRIDRAWHHRTKSGEVFPVEVSAHSITFQDRPCRIAVARDITDRVQAWGALEAAEARYRKLVESLEEGVAIVDAEARYVFGNSACERIFGATREQLEGRTFHEFLDPAFREKVEAERAARREGRSSTYEVLIRRMDGEARWIMIHSSPRLDAEGRFAGSFVTFNDTTERRRTLEALKESEERYRSVIEQSGDMIFLLALDTKQVVQSNPAFREALGYADPEGSGIGLYDLVAADRDSVDRNIEQVRTQGYLNVGRRKYRHADGSLRDVEVSAMNLRASGRPLMAVVARDITEQLRSERALQQAQKLESLGLLAGSVAHDFNNLLTAMMGNLNLAQLKAGKGSPAAPHLEDLEQTLLRAAELTRQMLAYSGRGQFVVKAVDLNQAVEEVCRMLSAALPKGASIEFHPGEILAPVEADPAQLQQVLMNLVTNAAESLDGRPGTIHIATSAPSAAPERGLDFQGQPLPAGDCVLLEVRDTGSGMDPEVLPRIFEPFFTTKASGRGLGLSAMLGILRGHKAGLQIESEPGKGSTFRIHFPAGARVQEIEPRTPASNAVVPSGIALVVDDEEEIRQAAASLFAVMGFREVLEAGDGEEALALFRERGGEISLVFMDLTMPRLSGRDAFRAMQALKPGVKVVLTSGYTAQEAFRDFEGDAPFGFIQKPYRFKQLREVVLKAIQQGA